jgi:general secretion pathway protein F
MIYPILMSVVGGAIVMGLFVFVIPRIRRVLESFGQTLPAITRITLGISELVLGWWWAIGLLGFGAFTLFNRWKATKEGRYKWHSFLLKAPVLGPIVRRVAVTRFCQTLSTLLDSGVPILTAVGIVERVVQNDVLAKAVREVAENISEGDSIAAPLRQSGEFPPLVTHMIAIGERTGELESMLGKVAESYESQLESTLEGLTSLLEPLLILVMGGVVGFIAMAIMLPMLNMSNSLR